MLKRLCEVQSNLSLRPGELGHPSKSCPSQRHFWVVIISLLISRSLSRTAVVCQT